MIDPFWYKVFVVAVLMVAQGVLWAWVGLQAQKHVSWWPIKSDWDVIAPFEGEKK